MGRMRRNGFQKPHNQMQVLTWGLQLLLVAVFFGWVVPLLPSGITWLAGGLFAAMSCAAVVLGYLTTAADPIDPQLKKQLIETPNRQARMVPRHGDDEKFCILCVANTEAASQHCRFCDKCVAGFDHHCKWLNNCVGRQNYRLFLGTVISVVLAMATFTAFTGLVLARWAMDEAGFQSQVRDVFGSSMPVALYLVLLAAFGVVAVGLGVAVAQLLSFHIFLIWNGMSTYDYILSL